MVSPVNPLIKDRKQEKWVNMKIFMGLVETEKVGDMDDKTR